MQAHIQQTYMRYLSLHTLCVARAYGITKDSKQPFANLGRRPKPAGLARARSYLHLGISTITKLLPMHIICSCSYHAFMHALHCMCVLHHQFRSKQQWAYAYALWRAAGRQATSYTLPLPSPLIKPISLTTTTTRTHNSKHTRTHAPMSPPMHLLPFARDS